MFPGPSKTKNEIGENALGDAYLVKACKWEDIKNSLPQEISRGLLTHSPESAHRRMTCVDEGRTKSMMNAKFDADDVRRDDLRWEWFETSSEMHNTECECEDGK